MPAAYLGLGSNKGDRMAYLQRAAELIAGLPGTAITGTSSVYETEPWGIKEQRDFLNCVLQIDTTLGVFELANKLKVIEKIVGRTDSSKWHEREIDIDLLFYSDLVINSEELSIPHSEIENRNFVLIPLLEIAPGLIHPIRQKTISELHVNSSDSLNVRPSGRLSVPEPKAERSGL